jgi:hypothetical protein
MSLTKSNGDAILKELYPDDVLKNLTHQGRPTLALIPKAQWDGDAVVVPVTYGNPAGVSNTFATAATNKANSKSTKFTVTNKTLFSLASINNEIIELSRSRKGAFAEALQYEVDNAMNGISNELAGQLFRSGGGSLGTVGSLTSTTITLTNAADAVNFEVGMVVAGDTVDGGGTVHSGSEPVTAVDRDAGVLTMTATSDISGLAAGDHLFRAGAYDAAVSGLASWLPASAPGATSFFGVDRSVDTSRLGGVRVSSSEVSGLPVEEKLQLTLEKLTREGGMPDIIACHTSVVRDLEISLGSKVQYQQFSVGDVGFDSIKMHGPAGAVKVVGDRFCPVNRAYALQLDTWKLRGTRGGLPAILGADGKMIREADVDSYEIRIGWYGNLICSAPGFNAVCDLS